MGLLDAFEVMPYVTGIPSMSVTKDGVSFNKATVEKLGSPAYVLILVDKAGNRLAAKPCEETTQGARPFLREGRSSRAGVRWNNTDLKDSIQKLTHWELDENGYKVTGDFFPDDNVMVFDLSKWTTIERRGASAD